MNEFDNLFDDAEKAWKWLKERMLVVAGRVLLGIMLWALS